ncbi:MAG: GNAT family N-acetyltransferase [Lachnospiraceae bacterium]|nr:GNAT family N-acetyltransferase [Lachnospiraceae bacterium]
MIHKITRLNKGLRESFQTLWNAGSAESPLPPLSEWTEAESSALFFYETDPVTGGCIGLCLVQDPDSDPWIFILVAKEHRRKGIATRLLEAAEDAVSSPALYYMSNTKEAPAANAFLKASGFGIFSRECIMKLPADRPETEISPSVKLRPCSANVFQPIYEACFDLPYQPDEGKFFQILNGDQTSVGGVALTEYKNGWFLFDLCILPKYRKKGYAQAAVEAAFREPLENGNLPDSILLHVSSLNAPAFALYEKMGFQAVEENILYERMK